MDINILKTFLEVHRTCHFGNAADNLFVTQATVSVRIKQLEDELGVQLFYRDRNNIQLTPAGHKFLRHAESILNIWNRARLDINTQDEGKIPFVIGALSNLWDAVHISMLKDIKNICPDIAITAEAVSGDNLIRRLLDQSIDLGFTSDYPQTSELIVVELFTCELVMVSCSKNENPEDAFKNGYIFVDWGTSYRNEHAKLFPDMPPADIRIGPGYIAHEYIRQNAGSAFLPEPTVRDDISGGKLFLVKNAPAINRKSFAIYSGNSAQMDHVKKIIHLISRNRDKH